MKMSWYAVVGSVHEKNKKNKTEVHHLKRKRADYLIMLWRNLAHKPNEIKENISFVVAIM